MQANFKEQVGAILMREPPLSNGLFSFWTSFDPRTHSLQSYCKAMRRVFPKATIYRTDESHSLLNHEASCKVFFALGAVPEDYTELEDEQT